VRIDLQQSGWTRHFPMSANFPQREMCTIGETRFVEMVFPEQANHYGTLYGGNALALLGKSAFVTASRYARCAVVMAGSERIVFEKPVRVGQLLEITGRVVRVGRCSMTVEVAGIAESLPDGARTPVLSGQFDMVAVDGDGCPVPIRPAR